MCHDHDTFICKSKSQFCWIMIAFSQQLIELYIWYLSENNICNVPPTEELVQHH